MDDLTKKKVWEKGRTVEGFSEDTFRKDCCGAWIRYEDYGDTTKQYGWEIDHVFPESRGGDSNLLNLRPMNWRNNREKGDDFPTYYAAVSSNGDDNVEVNQRYTVNEKLRKKLLDMYG